MLNTHFDCTAHTHLLTLLTNLSCPTWHALPYIFPGPNSGQFSHAASCNFIVMCGGVAQVRFSQNIDFQFPMKKACENEIKLYCKDIPHGEARVIRCAAL